MDTMMRSRGYSTKQYKTLETAYYNKPTELQEASYHLYLKELIRLGDVKKFRAVMASGISPNPCNAYGESLVHNVCKRGDVEFLKILIASGCSLQVADDCGRTPLHDACWAAKPCFEVIEILLREDRRLIHLTDCRGATPLSYVRRDQYKAFLEFLESKKDEFWAKRLVDDGEEGPPDLALYAPNTRPLLDPPNALPPQLAAMVATGRMGPDEAYALVACDKGDDGATGEETESEYEDDSDDSQSDDDSQDSGPCDDDDDDDAGSSLDEEELREILCGLTFHFEKDLNRVG